ncbi:HK97 gp10 family phage protein [bacterium]|nr:HK97 gp10 family phage protein [bacterium]
MEFNIDVDDNAIQQILQEDKRMDLLERGMRRVALILERKVKENLTGPILNVQTGRLRSSITHEIYTEGNDIVAEVGSNVIYLAPHEFGAIITPKNAQYLVIPQNDGTFRKVSQVELPERAPLRKSWQQVRNRAIDDLMSTLRQGLENA